MPAGGAEARGRQSALLARIAQEKFTDQRIGKLLDDLRPYEESLPYDSDDASLIRVTRREYERALQDPAGIPGRVQRALGARLPGLDRGAPGQRLRRRAAQPGEDARPQPPAGRLLPRLRAHRRPADRLRRLRHEGLQRPRPVRRAARGAGADRQGHHRHSRPPTTLPAQALSRGGAAGLRRSRWSGSSATTSTAGAWTRPTIPS